MTLACLTEVEIFQGDKQEALIDLKLKPGADKLSLFKEDLLAGRFDWGSRRVSLYLSRSQKRTLRVLGPGFVHKTVGEWKFRVSRGSFFQVNEFMLEILIQRATQGPRGSSGPGSLLWGGILHPAAGHEVRPGVGGGSKRRGHPGYRIERACQPVPQLSHFSQRPRHLLAGPPARPRGARSGAAGPADEAESPRPPSGGWPTSRLPGSFMSPAIRLPWPGIWRFFWVGATRWNPWRSWTCFPKATTWRPSPD